MENFLESPVGDAAFAKLMQAPVADASRVQVRTRRSPKIAPAVVITCLADIWYTSKRGRADLRRARKLVEPIPSYYDWLKGKMSAKDARYVSECARKEWAAIRGQA